MDEDVGTDEKNQRKTRWMARLSFLPARASVICRSVAFWVWPYYFAGLFWHSIRIPFWVALCVSAGFYLLANLFVILFLRFVDQEEYLRQFREGISEGLTGLKRNAFVTLSGIVSLGIGIRAVILVVTGKPALTGGLLLCSVVAIVAGIGLLKMRGNGTQLFGLLMAIIACDRLYNWLQVSTTGLLLCSVVAIVAGIGLLNMRGYGIQLFGLLMAIIAYDRSYDWLQASTTEKLRQAPWVALFVTGCLGWASCLDLIRDQFAWKGKRFRW